MPFAERNGLMAGSKMSSKSASCWVRGAPDTPWTQHKPLQEAISQQNLWVSISLLTTLSSI